ncbi:MAG: FAD-dependent oxidoreductase [Candidatus Fermentithermobacillus carboniphilus]|uniref:FAD-dependent oxidoreductase n=1 Tax=Candidatus Fermentithermobacillus carboniphilus TaxID=3085328 RepID=A0AAT9LDH4_9FIRM|nr:MAG: FAD-dependent oxidoreductase [Candidatus Fermentithermobacillus carboniphilus]
MSKKLVVIGGVAAGAKAAAKARREHPDWEIVVLEKGEDISYAGCGLPYFIGDVIKEREELVVRTPEYFKDAFNIDVLVHHEATRVDVDKKEVCAKDLVTGEEKVFPYDKLVIATGASPVKPRVPGIDLPGVFTLRTVSDAEGIRRALLPKDSPRGMKGVVVGGGMIGIEVAENLKLRGLDVTVVELTDQVLPGFDFEMARLVQKHMEEKGVRVLTGEKVESIEKGEDGKVATVITSQRRIPCDVVIWATGVRPDTSLPKGAGIELGPTGAIKVNENMETSVKDVFAVGDCAENVNLITQKPAWYPMGSTANKMGRIAALNLEPDRVLGEEGGAKTRPGLKGVLGTTVLKVFDMNAAKTGLSEAQARAEGFDVETVLVPANDRAHYYPGYRMIVTKLVADKKTGRILGAQVVGDGVVDKPIDIIVTAITLGARVEDLQNLDLAYAPPFSMAMSSTIVAANVMMNKLTGRVKGIDPVTLKRRLGDENLQIVDVRTPAEIVLGTIPGAIHIPLNELSSRCGELDRSKEQVLVCKVGLRAYLGSLILKNKGFENVKILDGGMTVWPYEIE